MNAPKEYEAVNAALSLVGQKTIAIPEEGTDREKVELLLDAYSRRLKEAVPAYKSLDTRLIPEVVVQHLLSILKEDK